MLKSICLILSVWAIVSCSVDAQELAGTVTYQHFEKYNFKSIFGEFESSDANAWVESLPTENKGTKRLCFSPDKALYEPVPGSDYMSQELRTAKLKADFFRDPVAEILKVYYDFENHEKIMQVEFMGRIFRIMDVIGTPSWKLTGKPVNILGYPCQSAELKEGDTIITAYFTPRIPASIGPADYFGLPGLILAVESNGETAFVAQSITMSAPNEKALSKPGKGKPYTRSEFDAVMAKKNQRVQKIQNLGR